MGGGEGLLLQQRREKKSAADVVCSSQKRVERQMAWPLECLNRKFEREFSGKVICPRA